MVLKCLDQRSHNREGPSWNPTGARAFFSSSITGRVSLIRSLKRGASLLFSYKSLAVLPEAKQAYKDNEKRLFKNLICAT